MRKSGESPSSPSPKPLEVMSRTQPYPILIFLLLCLNVFSQTKEGIHDGWKCSPEDYSIIETDQNSFVIFCYDKKESKFLLIECYGQSFKSIVLNKEIPITYWTIKNPEDDEYHTRNYLRNGNVGYIKLMKSGKKPTIEIVLIESKTMKSHYSKTRKLKLIKN